MSDSEMSPASKTSDVHRLVMRLNHQYTTQNDGGGLGGWCRVSSGDLLELLRLQRAMAEHAKEYFKILDWKAAAEKTKLGDKDYIDPKGYDAALAHYRKLMLEDV